MRIQSIILSSATIALFSAYTSPAIAEEISCPPLKEQKATDTQRSAVEDDKFKSAIDNVYRVQFPNSSTCITVSNIKKGKIIPNHFYQDVDGNLIFKFDGKRSNRLELRGENYPANISRTIKGQFTLPDRDNSAARFTMAQVFSETTGKPIFRISYERNKNNLKDKIWAWYRVNKGDPSATSQVLCDAPDDEKALSFSITYSAEHGKIVIRCIKSGEKEIAFASDLGTYKDSADDRYYFKAGCYSQSDGKCEVSYKALTIADGLEDSKQ